MDFKWAVTQMKEGKKVRRKSWIKNMTLNPLIEYGVCYHKIGCGSIGPRANYDFEDFEADDWEIYEDEWTLSDKYVTDSRIGEDRLWYEDKDVKEFIKRLKEEIRQSEYVMFSPGIIYEFIDKLAGDELR
jgi:hypothetical protein